jgi:type II secretory pathway component PulM
LETRERIDAQLQAARQEQAFIEAVGGTITALKEQAKGTGASAQQAQGYIKTVAGCG